MAPTNGVQTADPDFSAEIVDELYRYRHKRLSVAMTLAVLVGIFGMHRFYLGKALTGVLMLLTGGGGLFWWIWDLFRVRAMVGDFNNKRRGRIRVIGSAVLLGLIGLSMGAISGATGIYEPVVIILVFIAVTLVAARWQGMARIPGLHGLSRWSHRLRLYYHTVDPGSIWLLALRPFTGVFIAPWQSRAHAEVRLYLQLGVSFALLFALMDVRELSEAGSLAAGFGLMAGEFVQTLVYTYAFVAPTGALLTTQLLLSRRDRVVWALSAVAVLFIYLGLLAVGAV